MIPNRVNCSHWSTKENKKKYLVFAFFSAGSTICKPSHMIPNRVNCSHWPTKENKKNMWFLHFFGPWNISPEIAPKGARRIFPTNSDLADILGDTDFDFYDFFAFLGSQVSRFPDRAWAGLEPGLSRAWAGRGPGWDGLGLAWAWVGPWAGPSFVARCPRNKGCVTAERHREVILHAHFRRNWNVASRKWACEAHQKQTEKGEYIETLHQGCGYRMAMWRYGIVFLAHILIK